MGYDGVNIEKTSVEIREKRLNSINGYEGTASDLCKSYDNKTLCNRDRSFTQCTTCSADQVMNQLSCIQDAAIVEHGPAGCSGDIPRRNLVNRSGRRARNIPVSNVQYINTNLTEKDTIYGGLKKLENAIREAKNRFNPKAIFVTTTCASAIIGDDIESVTDKIEKEIGIPVVAIYCEGFRSRIWATGFDASYHGILRKIVKPAVEKKTNVVNIINFHGTDVFSPLLAKIGLKVNYIVPFTTIEQLSHISEAVATLQICSSLGTYLAAGLEKYFGVPEVKAPGPYGASGFNAWIRELGKIVHKEEEVEKLIEEEKNRTASRIAELREKLAGKRVFIGAGSAYAHGIIAIVKELGMELVSASTWHHDPIFDNFDKKADTLRSALENYGDFKISVCNKQSYELVSMLYKYKPDIYIGRHTGTIWATKLGIPSFLSLDEHYGVGYQGLINYGELILDTISNTSFVKGIAAHNKLPYTDWWLKQETFRFMEESK